MKKLLLMLCIVSGLFGCDEKDRMKMLLDVEIDQDIAYVLHEPEEVRGNLIALVYDIPYFSAWG